MKTFDFYEFVGVLTPGAVVLYTVSKIAPSTGFFINVSDFTVGDLGLFVILAYVVGHLVQTVGNVLETIFWKPFGGMSTNWVLNPNCKLLSGAQIASIPGQLQQTTSIDLQKPLSEMTSREWFPITRQIYAAVSAAGLAQRADTFNGNYGMFRGISAAFLLCAVLNAVVYGHTGWPMTLGLLGAAILALIRMHRFGSHYARELFVQFLQIKPEKTE